MSVIHNGREFGIKGVEKSAGKERFVLKILQVVMLSKKQATQQMGFYSSFEEQLSHQHPLYILANKIKWDIFDKAFARLYASEGRPAKPIRLMVALLLLKHLRNLSDEGVVEQ